MQPASGTPQPGAGSPHAQDTTRFRHARFKSSLLRVHSSLARGYYTHAIAVCVGYLNKPGTNLARFQSPPSCECSLLQGHPRLVRPHISLGIQHDVDMQGSRAQVQPTLLPSRRLWVHFTVYTPRCRRLRPPAIAVRFGCTPASCGLGTLMRSQFASGWAQVRTFKGSPTGAVIAKNGKIPVIFSQSVFFSVGVASLTQK